MEQLDTQMKKVTIDGEVTTSAEESEYVRLKDCTSTEVSKLEGKLVVLWSLATMKGVPLAGMAKYCEGEGDGKLVWYLVPKYGAPGFEDPESLDVVLYSLHPEDMEDVQNEHRRFRREIGNVRDYFKAGPEDGEGEESVSTADKSNAIRTEYRSGVNYGMLRVKFYGKVVLNSILNPAREGVDKSQK